MHTGIKPYQCEGCTSRFSCIGNLIKHRRTRPETCGLPKYRTNVKVAPRASAKNPKKKMLELTDELDGLIGDLESNVQQPAADDDDDDEHQEEGLIGANTTAATESDAENMEIISTEIEIEYVTAENQSVEASVYPDPLDGNEDDDDDDELTSYTIGFAAGENVVDSVMTKSVDQNEENWPVTVRNDLCIKKKW